MAKRYIGDAVITIAYRDQGDYAGTIRAGGYTWRFDNLWPSQSGFGPGIGYDSPEAYDQMAQSAVNFGSNPSEESWSPSEEVASAIADATQGAMDDQGNYEVRRSAKGMAREESSHRDGYYIVQRRLRNGRVVEFEFNRDEKDEALADAKRLAAAADPGEVVRLLTLDNELVWSSAQLNEAPTHHVADFSTLDDLVAHARQEGATHVLHIDDEIHLYFKRRDGRYEKSEVWQKDGYWHTQGPGSRAVVSRPPTNAQPIGEQRRTAETVARKPRRREPSTVRRAETAGIEYASEQIGSEHFMNWVNDQLVEASKMDPSRVHPLETKADAARAARAMLQQLEWDTKRDLKATDIERQLGIDRATSDVISAFNEGLHRGLSNPSTVDWLAEEILEQNKGLRGGGAKETRRHSGPQPNSENRARLAGYIAHAVMYDVSTSPNDLVRAYHLSPEEAQAVLSDQGGWFGPGGKGYAAYVKHIEKVLKNKEWFSAPDPKAIPGAARAYGRYVWLLENAASGDQGRKDKSDTEELQRELSNVGFNGWGLAIDNWPEAQRYYDAAPSVYRRHRGEVRESSTVRDYIAVDRNDRKVAGPFRSRGEADKHVPPGGYVKFSSSQHRKAPPPPSSYPMFREGDGIAERLLAAGAKTYAMMPDAVASVRGFNPAQAIFFAMTSRRKDARVAAAAIGKSEMERTARRIGGVVKLGYVVDGVAYVLPKP